MISFSLATMVWNGKGKCKVPSHDLLCISFCLELHDPVDLIVDEIVLLVGVSIVFFYLFLHAFALSTFVQDLFKISSHLFFYCICRATEASGSGCAASWTARPSRTPASTSSALAARRPGSTSTLRSCSATCRSQHRRTAFFLLFVVPCPAEHVDDCGADPRCRCRASARFLPSAAARLHDLIRSDARSVLSAARNGTGMASGIIALAFPVAGRTA